MVKNRYLKHKINLLLQMFPAVAIIGARQCGKSTLAKDLRPEWRYYDLESPSDYQLISDDPRAFFFETQPERLIMVEPQQ